VTGLEDAAGISPEGAAVDGPPCGDEEGAMSPAGNDEGISSGLCSVRTVTRSGAG